MSKQGNQKPSEPPKTNLDVRDIDAFKRIEFAIECIGRFYRRAFVTDLIQKKFNVAQRTAYRDYEKAIAEMAEYAKENKDNLIGRTVTEMQGIARRAAMRKEFGVAIQAIKHRDDVLGLTGKVELSGKLEQTVTHAITGVSDKALAALGDAYAGAAGGDRGEKPSKVRKKQDPKGGQPTV